MTDRKIDLVLDLDNTLIYSTGVNRKKIFNYRYTILPGDYRIYHRPYLQEFLDYAFNNFNVSIWTAGSREYAYFIYNNIINTPLPYEMDGIVCQERIDRKIKNIYYDIHCDESSKKYSHETAKDLRYLYDTKQYFPCGTIIIDDRPEVTKVNPNNTVRIPAFFAYKEEDDTGLLNVISKLNVIKKRFYEKDCV
jgi:hypothetical protein